MAKFQKKQNEVVNAPEMSEQQKDESIQETKKTPGDPKSYQPIETAPRTGEQIILSLEDEGEGVLCFWRKTRKLESFKWILTGRWANAFSRRDIDFIPKYWKQK